MSNSNKVITEPTPQPGDRVIVLNPLSWQRLCMVNEILAPHRARSYMVNQLISERYDLLIKDVRSITALEGGTE